jgi:hypothetical protein
MLCPNCGEENPQAYRFCGMCGTSLQAKDSHSLLDTPRSAHGREIGGADEVRSQSQTATRISERRLQPEEPVNTISGPSLLGLDAPAGFKATDDNVFDPFRGAQAEFEAEERVRRRRRILALVAVLLAVAAAARWTYLSYDHVAGKTTASGVVNNPGVPAPAPAATTRPAATSTANASPAITSPAAATTAQTSQQQTSGQIPQQQPSAQLAPETPAGNHAEAAKPAGAPVKNAETIAADEPPAKPAMSVTGKRPKDSASAASSVASSVVTANMPAPDDDGDADYKRAEAYLYGHGVGESCEQAVKFLKTASAKQNAKARSMFGTMYATGHCVPRDLPTSYGWFALALQADPKNQILEKDLTAIWNQMTPPERQLATRSKP